MKLKTIRVTITSCSPQPFKLPFNIPCCRFQAGAAAQDKRGLVDTYLDFCAFYRPNFFILENVQGFSTFGGGEVLRWCLGRLVGLGYQCTAGVLQAGQHGLAQSRRRFFLVAAAPGEALPRLPPPQHVFPGPQARGVEAPLRTVTVWDTISDLPAGPAKSYGGEARSSFQACVRRGSVELRDHLGAQLSALDEARVRLVPASAGADWRDLPNTPTRLRDSRTTSRLEYRFEDCRRGRSGAGARRGVCPCREREGAPCLPAAAQKLTIIPWFLPHKADQHNQYAGRYGRLDYSGTFPTAVTSPSAGGMPGWQLHPEHHRLLTIREMARVQGFPDTYTFVGSIAERYRQVGNAVPPPLGRALGLAIRAALALRPPQARVGQGPAANNLAPPQPGWRPPEVKATAPVTLEEMERPIRDEGVVVDLTTSPAKAFTGCTCEDCKYVTRTHVQRMKNLERTKKGRKKKGAVFVCSCHPCRLDREL